MGAEDIDVDLDHLIALVQERPPLWDKTSEDFNNRFQRANEWAAICKILFPEYDQFDDIKRNRIGNDVVKKWRSVKDNFFRYVKKTLENRKSGLPAKKMKRYHYYHQLRFLLKVANPKSDLQQETGSSSPRTPAMEPESTSTTTPASFKRTRSGLHDEPLGTQAEREERNILFFRAIMPSLINFTDLQMLTFQRGLLQIIAEIRFGQQPQISSTSVGLHNPSHQDVNADCNDDSQEEFDFTVKIEKS